MVGIKLTVMTNYTDNLNANLKQLTLIFYIKLTTYTIFLSPIFFKCQLSFAQLVTI